MSEIKIKKTRLFFSIFFCFRPKTYVFELSRYLNASKGIAILRGISEHFLFADALILMAIS